MSIVLHPLPCLLVRATMVGARELARADGRLTLTADFIRGDVRLEKEPSTG